MNDLIEDREGNIWIATDDGIDRLRDLPVRSFGQRDGMQSISANTLLTLRNGHLLFSDGTALNSLQSGNVGHYPTSESIHRQGLCPDHISGKRWIRLDELG